MYIYVYIFKKFNPDGTLNQEQILGNATVTNIDIFSITHIPRSFTDRIRRTEKYL